jgi:hypothetical protein
MKILRVWKGLAAAACALLAGVPAACWACACGCGVFEVGTSSLFPTGTGGIAYLEYDLSHQNTNWHGGSRASPDDNTDKEIRTQFYTAGLNYMFNHSWGLMVQLPYWHRDFKTDVGDQGAPDIEEFHASGMGDIRLDAMYTGFSDDMSLGLLFGVKLPTGDYTNPNFDRDTQIGTGSTDLRLGAYKLGTIGTDGTWNWFVQGMYERAVATRAATSADSGLLLDYRPGDEVDAAAGISYNFGQIGPFTKVALIGQLKGTVRQRDTGGGADNIDSGYERVLLAPGIEADVGAFRFYAEVGVPIHQRTNGDQLTSPTLIKVLGGWNF